MENKLVLGHSMLLAQSFFNTLGKDLSPFKNPQELAKHLYYAPFALVSHNIAPEPIFNYCNLQAQELWEMDWEEFTQMPSSYSAEPMLREAREYFLQQVRSQGYVQHYKGVRISKSGKRFEIQDVIIWNLYDDRSEYRGQAALVPKWKFL